MFDFAGKRWWYLWSSFVIFVIAAVCLAVFQLKPGIEFTAGSTATFEFTQQTVKQEDLRGALADLGHDEARVQGAGSNSFLIRTDELENAPPVDGGDTPVGPVPQARGEIDDIQDGLCARFGVTVDGLCSGVNRQDFSTVSETVSKEIGRNATIAVAVAAAFIMIYIAFSFRTVPGGWRNSLKYGAAAIIAVLHDAFIVLGLFAVLGAWRGVEVDTAFITAILTVIGFSVHDTIVVFDRIRETVTRDPYIPFEEAVNASMMETIARSINTSLVVVLTVLAMLLIGGVTIRNFLLVLLVGIVSGTYSSIAIASQLLVAWENNDIGKFFRRVTGRGAAAAAAPTVPEAAR